MKLIVYIVTFFILTACQSKSTQEKHEVKKEIVLAPETVVMQEDSIAFNKSSLLKTISKYGQPLLKKEFILEDIAITEFRIELYNVFSKKQMNNQILIQEVTWELNKDSLITVWYQEKESVWKPVHTITYNKNTEF